MPLSRFLHSYCRAFAMFRDLLSEFLRKGKKGCQLVLFLDLSPTFPKSEEGSKISPPCAGAGAVPQAVLLTGYPFGEPAGFMPVIRKTSLTSVLSLGPWALGVFSLLSGSSGSLCSTAETRPDTQSNIGGRLCLL